MLSQFDNSKPLPKPSFSAEVTIQGLRPITDGRSSLLRRVFWLGIFCGGLAFTGYNISQQILHYLSTPINVHVDVKLEDTLTFPAVTICTTSFLKRSTSEFFNVTGVVKQLYSYDFLRNQNFNESLFDFSTLDSKAINELLEKFTFRVNDSVIMCDWDGLSCNSDAIQHISTDFGLCFIFNGHGQLNTRSSGRQNGLRLHLNALSEEFTRSRDSTEGVGFMIAVHSPDAPVIMNDIGIALSPGRQHFFGIDLLKMESPTGLDKCGTKSLKYFKTRYTREACRLECVTDFLVDKCSCRETYMPGNASLCIPSQSAGCVVPALKEYTQHKAECDTECPQSCEYTSYSIKTQSGLVLTEEYLTAFADFTNKTLGYWKKNFVSLEVYFTSMSYTYITKRYGYSVLDLMCDIGGALGLCLGASLVTALEVMDFSLRTVFACWGFKETTKRIDVRPK